MNILGDKINVLNKLWNNKSKNKKKRNEQKYLTIPSIKSFSCTVDLNGFHFPKHFISKFFINILFIQVSLLEHKCMLLEQLF